MVDRAGRKRRQKASHLEMVVSRKTLDAIIQSTHDYGGCRLYGPPRSGKSVLMQRVRAMLVELGAPRAVYQNLQNARNDTPQGLLQHFQQRLEADPTVGQPEDLPLTAVIDGLDILPANVAASHLESVMYRWRPDRLIVCSTTPLQAGKPFERLAYFLAVTPYVILENLTPDECEVLLKAKMPGFFPKNTIDALYRASGGSRFLIEQVLETCEILARQQIWRRITPERLEIAIGTLIAERSVLWQDVLGRIAYRPEFLDNLEALGEGRGFHLPDSSPGDSRREPHLLEFCDVIARAGVDEYGIKAPLWQRLVQHFLSVDRISDLYLQTGHWKLALALLEQQPTWAQNTRLSEDQLFAVILTALQNAPNPDLAFSYLGRGIQTYIPGSSVQIFLRTDAHLELVFPSDEPKRLSNTTDSPEWNALERTGYSSSSVGDVDVYYFPIRYENEAVGLVRLERVPTQDLHQQRVEAYRLVRFLERIGPAQGWPQSKLPRFVDAIVRDLAAGGRHIDSLLVHGITSQWGLAFNRAVLWLRQGDEMIPVLGTGHLDEATARADWEHFVNEFHDIDAFIEHLETTETRYSAFYDRLADMRFPVAAFDVSSAGSVSDPKNLPARLSEILEPPGSAIWYPMFQKGELVGALYADEKFTRRNITFERSKRLREFVDKVEALRATHKSQQQADRLARLLEALQDLNLPPARQVDERGDSTEQNKQKDTFRDQLSRLTQSARKLFDAFGVVLYTVVKVPETGNFQNDEVVSDPPELVENVTEARLDSGVSRFVLEHGRIAIPNLLDDVHPLPINRRFIVNSFVRQHNIRRELGLRIGSEAAPLGLLYINWKEPGEFAQEALEDADQFVRLAAVALQEARWNALQKAELDRRRREQRLLETAYERPAEIEPGFNKDIDDAMIQTLKQTGLMLRSRDGSFATAGGVHIALLTSREKTIWRVACLDDREKLQYLDHEAIGNPLAVSLNQAFTEFGKQRLDSSSRWPFVNWSNPRKSPTGDAAGDSQRLVLAPVKADGNCLGLLFVEATGEPTKIHNCGAVLAREASAFSQALASYEQIRTVSARRKIIQTLSDTGDTGKTLTDILSTAYRVLRGLQSITVYRQDNLTGQITLKAQHGLRNPDGLEPLGGDKLLSEVLADPDPIFNGALVGSGNPFARREGIRSAASFPLQTLTAAKRAQTITGRVFFNYHFHRRFDRDERETLEFIVGTITTVLAREQIIARTFAEEINPGLDLNDVLGKILKSLQDEFPKADHLCIVSLEGDTLVIDPLNYPSYQVDGYNWRPPTHGMIPDTPLRVPTTGSQPGIARRAIRDNRIFRIPDVLNAPDYIEAISTTRSQLTVPLANVNRAVVLESDTPDAFDQNDADKLIALVPRLERIFRQSEEASTQRQIVFARSAELFMHELNNATAIIPDDLAEIKAALSDDQMLALEAPLTRLDDTATEIASLNQRYKELINEKDFRPCMLADLLKTALDSVNNERRIEIETSSLAGCDFEVNVVQVLIDLIVRNLLSNAYRHARSRVEIFTERIGHMVRIHVRDDGEGVEERIKATLFNEERRVDPMRNLGSPRRMGIGLPISRMFARAHGGELELLSSNIETGSVFCLSLPILRPL